MSRDFSDKLSSIRKYLSSIPIFRDKESAKIALFISVTDGEKRAETFHVIGYPFESVWQKSLATLQKTLKNKNLQGNWLRIDWVEQSEKINWGILRERLKQTKRNYFRYGLALDENFSIAFLEQELNANAMLYGGNAIEHALLNEKNFLIYAKKRFGADCQINFSDDQPVFVLSTRGIFCDEKNICHPLNGPGLNAGRRHFEELHENDLFSLIKNGSDYLSRQVKSDGRFIYGTHPCFDRQINAYNALRHASSVYAMIESWQLTQSETLKQAIDRAIDYLTSTLIKTLTLPSGEKAAFLVEANNEIKLGGNAVCLLALCEYSKAYRTNSYSELLEQLALGIAHMQNEDSSFTHVLIYPGLEVKDPFRIIYYDGEAAFGLMRLYKLTQDKRWLEIVEKAFNYFIANQYWKYHDHWLAYCVNELTLHRQNKEYYHFGIQNFDTYLDFIENRITTFPTLLELMMAAEQMLTRMREQNLYPDLLKTVDFERFYRSLEARVQKLLNGYFWPEYALFFANPRKITGSFFIRHHAFRIRIDDLEHYLSGLTAYLRYKKEQKVRKKEDFSLLTEKQAGNYWNADEVLEATGGEWLVPVSEDWFATGLCTLQEAYEPHHMVLHRTTNSTRGLRANVIQKLTPPPSAIITHEDITSNTNIPILKVKDAEQALLDLGVFARSKITGKVIGITGSAGKTSCTALFHHVFQAWGKVEQTRQNANLSHGIAWNFASFNRNADFIFLEMAIGRMYKNAQIARPHIAVILNILPAHLGPTNTLQDIALTKSAIFSHMKANDIVVLNRDMLEWETVYSQAKKKNLHILHYGKSDDCDLQLVSYDAVTSQAVVKYKYGITSFSMGAQGEHMALNALAVLSVLYALGYDFNRAYEKFKTFQALQGRGQTFDLTFKNQKLRIIDDSYNANPGSMKAAINRLDTETIKGRRILVLGEMAELGSDEIRYHTELADLINQTRIDRVHVVGSLYKHFWNNLYETKKGFFSSELQEAKESLQDDFKDNDVILLKGSNSTKIHTLIDWFQSEK